MNNVTERIKGVVFIKVTWLFSIFWVVECMWNKRYNIYGWVCLNKRNTNATQVVSIMFNVSKVNELLKYTIFI